MKLLKKLPGTIIALLVYYVLPLAGDVKLLYNWQIWIPMLVCAMIYLTQPSASTNQFKNPEDKNSMLFLAISTSISQFWIVAEWAYFQSTHEFEFDFYSLTGAIFMISGFAVRWWAIRKLQKHFSNEVRLLSDHKLIQTGPYAYIRHGSYTGALFVAIGIGVFLQSWTGVMITIPLLSAAYAYRINIEEIRMIKGFGQLYIEYQSRTKKMVPYIW